MPIDLCMKTHTRRQLSAWMAWLDMEMNNPNRSDWYLMQITAEIQRLQLISVRAKSLDVDINQLRLKLRSVEKKRKEQRVRRTQEERQDLSQEDSRNPEEILQEETNLSKAIWLSYATKYKSRIDMKDERHQKFNRQDF